MPDRLGYDHALPARPCSSTSRLDPQGIDFNKFSNMNVIAQEKLASAFGLQTDELSDQLLKLVATWNIRPKLVTFETSQFPIFWLNDVALLNVCDIAVTLLVFQPDNG